MTRENKKTHEFRDVKTLVEEKVRAASHLYA